MAIILINYNGLSDTIDCINSINDSNTSNFTIYVVDNCSSESCRVLEQFDNTKVIYLKENLGFGIANNYGAEEAIKDGAEYLLCLNNDTIVSKEAINLLRKSADNNTIVTCAIYYYSNRAELWYGGGEVSKLLGNFRHKRYSESKYISFISGCCMMITKECYSELGLFDPEYFMYCEDVDYSLKAILNGYRILYVHDAKIWHKVGQSINKSIGAKDYYLTRNRLYVMKKYRKYFYFTAWIFFYCTRIARIITGKCKNINVNPVVKGIHDYHNNKMGKLNDYFQ